jgi:hypothetical protein
MIRGVRNHTSKSLQGLDRINKTSSLRDSHRTVIEDAAAFKEHLVKNVVPHLDAYQTTSSASMPSKSLLSIIDRVDDGQWASIYKSLGKALMSGGNKTQYYIQEAKLQTPAT